MEPTKVCRYLLGGVLLIGVCFLAGCGGFNPLGESKPPLTEEEQKKQDEWIALVKKQHAEREEKKAAAEKRKQDELERPSRFRDSWPKYLAVYNKLTRDGSRRAEMGSGHLRGKAVILDAATQSEGMRYLLTTKMEAQQPSEVGTVVVVNADQVTVGAYGGGVGPTGIASGGGAARQQVWTLTLIDWPNRELIAIKSFVGTPPPKVIHGRAGGGGGASGDAPIKKAQEYMKGLDRRPL